jgi:hypothetical protein
MIRDRAGSTRVSRYNPKLATAIGTAARRRSQVILYVSLLAVVVLFFHKPLFNSQYIFPWDFRGVQLPLISFLRDQLRENRFALWNPYSYGGYPIFANIQACFFHPLVLLSAFLSSRMSWASLPLLLEWSVVLQIWIAGIASYHLFREWGAGTPSAWAGAVILQTGGYFASRTEHIDSVMAAAWMPLAWLVVWKLREEFRLDWIAVLAASLGMSVWGGFPQATLAVFVSTALLAVLLVVLKMGRPSVIAATSLASVLGILLASAPFIPTTQLTNYSVAQYRADWLGSGGGLYWQSLVSLVAPDHYHIFDLRQFKGPGDPTFLYLYASITGLLLAFYALAARRNRITALLVMLLLFGAFWMLGDKTPAWRVLYPLLPEKIRIGIHPEYTYCIFSLVIAGLAALGLESLRIPSALRWVIAVVIAADLFLVGSGRPMNSASLKDEAGVTPYAFDGSALLLNEIQHYVNQTLPPSRIDTVDATLGWAFGAPIIHVPNANGVSPLALENTIQLRLLLHDGNRAGWYYPVQKVDSPVLDLLNVRYVITWAEAAPRLAALTKFHHVASLPGNELFENLTVLPRFFLVHDVRSAKSVEQAKDMIARGKIDLGRTAVAGQEIALPAGGAPSAADRVEILDYQPASLHLAVESRGTSFLVLSETYYPGWRAWLDGQPASIYPTDIALRGMVIPPGRHDVRMRFEPSILPVSLAVAGVTAILLAALGFLCGARTARIQSN